MIKCVKYLKGKFTTFNLFLSFLFLSSVLSLPLQLDTDNFFSFLDELENYNLTSFEESGWTIIGSENYISFTSSTVILRNVCYKTAWIRYYFNTSNDFTYWVAQSRGRWINGDIGSLHIIVSTDSHEYAWWGDGYDNKFKFFIGSEKKFEKDGYNPGYNSWHNFTLVFESGRFKMFFNDELIYTYFISSVEKIKGIGVNSPWCSRNGYCSGSDCSSNEYDSILFFGIKHMIPKLFISSPSQAFSNETINIYSEVFYNSTPLIDLTQSNFQLLLDDQNLSILDFHNFLNGSYLLTTILPSNLFGERNLKVKINYENQSAENSTTILIYSPPLLKERTLFISDEDWKNILSLAPLKRPTIISNSIDENILHFIKSFNPTNVVVVGNVSGYEVIQNLEKLENFNDVYQRFFLGRKGVYVCEGHSNLKGMYLRAALIASALDKPVVFNKTYADENYKFCSETVGELEDKYLNLLNNTNFLIVSNHNPLAVLIASQKNAFVVFTSATNSTKVKEDIIDAVKKLNAKGFFTSNPKYPIDSAYLLLMDRIKSFNIKDFESDILYGDLDENGIIDVSVSRLPENTTIASLVFARSFLDDNKKALVASEYLNSNYLVILLTLGGGMLQGRNVAEILEKQGYDVDRLVEKRSNIEAFLKSLSSKDISIFLTTVKKIEKKLKSILGGKLAVIISKVLIILKGLQFIEQGLEAYYEYNWNTFPQNLWSIIDDIITGDLGIDTLIKIWPVAWKQLTRENLIESIKEDKSILYYVGLNNKTHWILPSRLPAEEGVLDYKTWLSIITNYRYDGSEAFGYNDIPFNNLKLVFDNSPNAAVSDLAKGFLEKGAASYIGSSSKHKDFFPSSAFESVFFKNENNLGKAFLKAVNHLILTNPNKRNSLSMMLFGDPHIYKDPEIIDENSSKVLECINGICSFNLTFFINYSLINNTIIFETDDYLTEELKPIIPLKTFEYYLSTLAELLNYSIELENETFYDIEIPIYFSPFSNITNITDTEIYPNFTYSLFFNKTIDNRTFVFVSVPTLFYNASNKTAIVVKKINVVFNYISPVDFSILLEGNVYFAGEPVNIPIKIFTELNDTYDVFIEITNQTNSWNYNFSFDFNGTIDIFNFSFVPEASGIYKVKAVLFKRDPILVGPKESTFSVEEAQESSICFPNLIITEIMYNPYGRDTGREWVEIFNKGNCDIDLSKIYFLDESGYHKIVVSGSSPILHANEYAIITTNVTQFKLEYPNANCLIVKSSFSLRNTNETIGLANSSKHVFESVFYSNNMGGNGNKRSLELKNNGVWEESLIDFGTPCSPSYVPQMLSSNEGASTTSSSRFVSLVKNESKIILAPNITLNESTTTNESSEQVEKKNETKEKEDIKTAFVTAPVKTNLDITNITKIIVGVLISVLVFVLLKFLIFK
ncbi:MAG: lamin tail domain-containing protein [Candidatus Aenigmatarchaeota archaeon]